jgi:hypothetical protein
VEPGTPKAFDIRTLLPPGFILRDPTVTPVLDVAPLPPLLQQHLAAYIDGDKTGKDDLADLLSQNHLQFLYSQFLGVRKGKATQDTKHPLWSKVNDVIRTTSDVANVPPSPAGLSFTINDLLRQFATAVGNLWEGSAYKKSLDYVTRILLRLHLAPVREAKYKEMIKKKTEEKANKKREGSRHVMRLKLWSWKIKRLMDQLAEAVRKGRSEGGVGIILRRLAELAEIKPAGRQGGFLALEDQLDQADASRPASDTLFEGDDDDDDDSLTEGEDVSVSGLSVEAPAVKEPSAARLRSLQVVLKTLLETPFIASRVTANWVRKTAYVRCDFTDRECQVVATLANLLRPYVPKRRTDAQGSVPHITLRAPLVVIANTLLRATGYPSFTREVAPSVSPASLHGLPLSAWGLYEMFCSKGEGRFDVRDSAGDLITNRQKTGKSLESKRQVFGAFFDLDTVDKICKSHGLQFANRITYVDRYTVRITGTVLPDGPSRHRVSSQYDARRKDFTSTPRRWMREFESLHSTEAEVTRLAEKAVEVVKSVQSKVTKTRQQLRAALSAQTRASILHRQAGGPDKNAAYAALKEARQVTRAIRGVVIPEEAALRAARSTSYYWNNVLKGAKAKEKADKGKGKEIVQKEKEEKGLTVASWSHFTIEDYTESLDIKQLLLNSRGKNRQVVFAGTDYGISKMSETCAQTLEEIEAHINRFQVLCGE